jgi:DNA mismatch repair protein MutS
VLEPDPALAALGASIRHQLVDSPPLSLSEGGLIHDGVDPLLDGLRNQLDDQESWLAEQEQLERQLSKNSNLKLQYHRTFGYFLSVSRARSGAVPDHWIRRQTLANEERFITPDLKAREGQIFQMRARAAQREYELFCDLRGADSANTQKRSAGPRGRSRALTRSPAWRRPLPQEVGALPEITADRSLVIEQGRHPVVEQLLVEDTFTPNDSDLGTGIDLVVLTGPNASGKSCYLRQIGLIQLLAQIGSWVPGAGGTDRHRRSHLHACRRCR